MNKVILVGNLTRDPESNEISGGVQVCRFTIAVNRSYVGADGIEADFFNITVWRKLAELCTKYLKKGRKVGIVGKIQNRTYEDKETGAKRYATDIIADDVEFLSAANASSSEDADYDQPKQTSGGGRQKPALQPINDDDMPF